MIRMGVGIDGIKQLRLKKSGQADIVIRLVKLRVDHDANLLADAGQNVGETTGRANLLKEEFCAAHLFDSRDGNDRSFFQTVTTAVDPVEIVTQKAEHHTG